MKNKPRVGEVRPPLPDTTADAIITENEVVINADNQHTCQHFPGNHLPVYVFLCSIESGFGLHASFVCFLRTTAFRGLKMLHQKECNFAAEQGNPYKVCFCIVIGFWDCVYGFAI